MPLIINIYNLITKWKWLVFYAQTDNIYRDSILYIAIILYPSNNHNKERHSLSIHISLKYITIIINFKIYIFY